MDVDDTLQDKIYEESNYTANTVVESFNDKKEEELVYEPICGNNVVEQNEECDSFYAMPIGPSRSCLTGCKFNTSYDEELYVKITSAGERSKYEGDNLGDSYFKFQLSITDKKGYLMSSKKDVLVFLNVNKGYKNYEKTNYAMDGIDFFAPVNPIRIPAGQSIVTFNILIKSDKKIEAKEEIFSVEIVSAKNVSLSPYYSYLYEFVVIRDDDIAPFCGNGKVEYGEECDWYNDNEPINVRKPENAKKYDGCTQKCFFKSNADNMPVVNFDIISFGEVVNEGDFTNNYLVFPLLLSHVTTVDVDVIYKISSTTAKPGMDYIQPNAIEKNLGIVTIKAGEGSANIIVPIISDNVKEETEEITLEIVRVRAVEMPRNRTRTVFIIDDD